MNKNVQPPRGFKDLLPAEAELKHRMIEVLGKTYESWGFLRVEAPAMENIDRLKNSDGGENTQMIFEVLKRGQKLQEALCSSSENQLSDLALRYDLTVPLSRFLATNQAELPKNVKFLQFGDVWRAERPQKGRFRQFMQWDADIFGYGAPNAEIDLICCTAEALLSLGLSGFKVRVNDRRILDALMINCGVVDADDKASCLIAIDKLDKIGVEGVKKELQRLSLPKSAATKIVSTLEPFMVTPDVFDLSDGISKLGIDLTFDWRKELAPIFSVVTSFSGERFSVVFDPSLVRGLGYYTGPIFEIEYGDYPFSIAGGGRYDGILEKFGKTAVPGCGFSLGFDRIMYVLSEEKRNLRKSEEKRLLVMVADQLSSTNIKEIEELRSKYDVVSLLDMVRNQKRLIAEYASLGFTHYAVMNAGGDKVVVKEITS